MIIKFQMNSERPASWKILSAFAIIYLVWGSTYQAIRVGVREMPPFLMAGLRFTTAGLALYLWMRFTGVRSPNWREWRGATILGTLMFLIDYACLFWAEQRVPSGVAAVILAAIPVCITLLEIVFLRTQRLTVRLAVGLAVGIIGVAVLMNPSSSLGEAPLDRGGAIVLRMVNRHHRQSQACSAGIKTNECSRSNVIGRRTVAGARCRRRRVREFPRTRYFWKRVVFVALSHHRGIDHQLHSLRLAAAL